MRRLLLSILAAVFGTALLVGLKAQFPGTGPVAALGLGADGDPASPGPGASGVATVGPSGAPPTGAGTSAAPGAPAGTPGAGPTTTGATTAAPPPTPSVKVTGNAIRVITATSPNAPVDNCDNCHDYTITVTLTITGGKITAATSSYNVNPGKSLSYYTDAATYLQKKILTAKTWNLGPYSGATYAANAWELSAKSAMSKAGLPV
jgi:hypothetical protein